MQTSELFNHQLASKAESLGKIPEEWLEVIYQEKWFKLFVPQELGGLGLNLKQALHQEEKLARLDGSLGWTVTLCAGAAWFVGYMDESIRLEFFEREDLCFAGSGFVGGKALRSGKEYFIKGRWTYASGALHATHFTANCEIIENGNPVLDEAGVPVVKAFILKKEEIEILDGWNYMGMVATGSHAFQTENLRVPLDRCFDIKPEKATLPDLIYKFPFLQFAEATLVVNILGISFHLMDLIKETFWIRHSHRKYDKKHLKYFEGHLKLNRKQVKSYKKKFYSQVDKAWEELENEGEISESRLKKISKSSRSLTSICRKVTAELFPYSGLEGAKTQSELNRVWRDFNTVNQHALLIFPF
ncbi:acyl-CoA dehydrogenase [Algoriphagus aestuarii]|nr:acyl-CoA dehydrogenase [Algoriphagus aestuarii]